MAYPDPHTPLQRVLAWFGFGHEHEPEREHGHHDHEDDHHVVAGGSGHSHGVVDPTIAATDRGIWAVKWAFVILAVTAALQLIVVAVSGSVALLADTIHNVGDATTAIPLWIAFTLVRRKPTARFTYGLGRVEDLAGATIVLIILASALVAGYESVDRLLHPKTIGQVGWVAAAGIIGFIGNEAVAIFRLRVGRAMSSVALIADGYHARTDGLTSLAVVLGAAGVWLGFPLADPIVGLLITVTLFGIVWQSAKAVFLRMLDGVEPGIVSQMRHAAEHVPEAEVVAARARWLGHRLYADVDIKVDGAIGLAKAVAIAERLRRELFEHLPALAVANIQFAHAGHAAAGHGDRDHEHAPSGHAHAHASSHRH